MTTYSLPGHGRRRGSKKVSTGKFKLRSGKVRCRSSLWKSGSMQGMKLHRSNDEEFCPDGMHILELEHKLNRPNGRRKAAFLVCLGVRFWLCYLLRIRIGLGFLYDLGNVFGLGFIL